MSATLAGLEALGAQFDLGSAPRTRRMLIVVNPYATTVSDRLKHLVVYALRGRYEVDAVDTARKDHATEIVREAASEGYDVVVAFGGDGTLNEVANGLAGTDTPLTCLPGGRTNVFCRMLGIPNDVVDATEHLLRIADDWHPRKVDLAHVNGRHFTFSSGVGLDASVVHRVDLHPRLKTRLGQWYFTYAAVTTFTRHYVVKPPRMQAELPDGELIQGVTAIVQNGDPFTYFGKKPVEVAEGASLDGGTLAGVVLNRATVIDIPSVLFRAIISRRARVVRHRKVTGFSGVDGLVVRSLDGRPLPVQVDGDYIGHFEEAAFSVSPRALTVVS